MRRSCLTRWLSAPNVTLLQTVMQEIQKLRREIDSRVEDLIDGLAPAWAPVDLRELISSFDGQALAEHWAMANGQEQLFSFVLCRACA